MEQHFLSIAEISNFNITLFIITMVAWSAIASLILVYWGKVQEDEVLSVWQFVFVPIVLSLSCSLVLLGSMWPEKLLEASLSTKNSLTSYLLALIPAGAVIATGLYKRTINSMVAFFGIIIIPLFAHLVALGVNFFIAIPSELREVVYAAMTLVALLMTGAAIELVFSVKDAVTEDNHKVNRD